MLFGKKGEKTHELLSCSCTHMTDNRRRSRPMSNRDAVCRSTSNCDAMSVAGHCEFTFDAHEMGVGL